MSGDNDELERLRREVEYYRNQLDELGAKDVKSDYVITMLRREVKQKRQGFAILTDLQKSFNLQTPLSAILEITVRAINSTLEMDKSVILAPTERYTVFKPSCWAGFPNTLEDSLGRLEIEVPSDLLLPDAMLLANRSSVSTPFIEYVRSALQLPFFVFLPIHVEHITIGGLISGRHREGEPFFPPLNQGDIDSLRAIASLISTSVQNVHIAELEGFERLLLNILPRNIALRLMEGECVIADSLSEVTVLFADLVGFTRFADQVKPDVLVRMLNQIFSSFDELVLRFGLEKVKTIGDAYMLVGGAPDPREDHVEAVAEMALAMLAVLAQFNKETGKDLHMRIGMHTGPVVAGVIGSQKYAYDLWGSTVNTASRMESTGMPGRIHVSEAIYSRLRQRYNLEERGLIMVKGIGEIRTYFLLGRKE